MRRILLVLSALLLSAPLLAACGGSAAPKKAEVRSETLHVKRVEGLPENFILGMDASSVLAEERSGVKYYNFAGEEQDVFRTLAENGITHIRVRVWNHPFDAAGNGYGGGNCDIAVAENIGVRAAQ